MSNKKVSDRYAKAIFQIAEEQNLLEKVGNDMEIVANAINSSRELENVTISPVIPYDKKNSVFQEIFKDSISTLTMDFLTLLIKKGRGAVIVGAIERFVELNNIKNNKLPVKVTTAVEMADATRDKVLERLSSQTGKTILPEFDINESIKGGVKVQIEDWVYDATIENQLREIHTKLIKGEN